MYQSHAHIHQMERLLAFEFHQFILSNANSQNTLVQAKICNNEIILKQNKTQFVQVHYIDGNLAFDILYMPFQNKNQVSSNVQAIIFKHLPTFQTLFTLKLIENSFRIIESWIEYLNANLSQTNFRDKFKNFRKIGQGNTAIVYSAVRISNEEKVAIKVFNRQDVLHENNNIDTIRNEIKIMRKLKHDQVISLNEVFETEKFIYLVMDHMEGGSLMNLIQNKTQLKQEEIKTILYKLLEATNYLHNNGIIHRDLKPDNILFRKINQIDSIVIADLGLACEYNNLPFMHPNCGTPGYVAPEIINWKEGKPYYGPKSDVFSIGQIANILLTGKSLFNARSVNSLIEQNCLCFLNLKTPAHMQIPFQALKLLKNMLEKEPENRLCSEECLAHTYFEEIHHTQDQNELEETGADELSMDEKMNQIIKIQGSFQIRKKSNDNFGFDGVLSSKLIQDQIQSMKPLKIIGQLGTSVVYLLESEEIDSEYQIYGSPIKQIQNYSMKTNSRKQLSSFSCDEEI